MLGLLRCIIYQWGDFNNCINGVGEGLLTGLAGLGREGVGALSLVSGI